MSEEPQATDDDTNLDQPPSSPPGDAERPHSLVAADSTAEASPLDLEAIERDLAGVDAALGRLDEGTYWTDEVTGEPIPDDVLAANPVARRAE